MSSGADPVVRGRQGPRSKPVNVYAHKDHCECEDGRGRPSPVLGADGGECVKCGRPLMSEKE